MKHLIFLMAGIMLAFFAKAQAPDGYYDSAEGLGFEQLQQALHDIIDNHTQLSYDDLWSAFYDTDPRPDNSSLVWDMYSDNPFGSEPYTYTFGTDQCGNYSGEGSCYNREHSFPKSWYNDGYPMYTDLVQLVPTDGYVNGMRGNLAYGEVDNVDWESQNGSKKGYSNASWATDMVFEPIDEYKGDFARIYFYMATRYKDEIDNWESNNTNADAMLNGTSYPAFESAVLDMLMQWHENDPPGFKESERNDAIYDWQGNRNPFVDHPEYVEYIWGNGPNNSHEIEKHTGMEVSPNPATDAINITFDHSIKQSRKIVIYDMCGKPVLTTNDAESSVKVNVKNLPAGMYFLQIKNDANYAGITTRIVIQ